MSKMDNKDTTRPWIGFGFYPEIWGFITFVTLTFLLFLLTFVTLVLIENPNEKINMSAIGIIRRLIASRSLSTVRRLATATDEIRKFDHFPDWWTSEEMKPLRAMNEVRIPLIVDNLVTGEPANPAKPLENMRIVDIGSGGGLVCEPLARLGARVTGIDPNETCVKYCQNRLDGVSCDLKANLDYHNLMVENYVNQNNFNSVDAIVASEVLEHVEDVESIIKAAHKLLKPNGHLFITTINQTIPAYLCAIVFGEYLWRLAPKGSHEYDLLVPLLSLKVMLEKNGFHVKLINGLKINPLTIKWSWTRFTDVSYAMVAVKTESEDK